ncbi:hypothetical protein [Pectinatus sottacetonis]|uniref:hypothetical protein n=1 Tax=Pectinatus sottacetonis TaxID=1002795 RepID=UPI0018C5B4E1|nr:hypothetical protein [Pectinatus sottacetonis]
MKTINAKEPSIENAKIELLGFYVNENKNIDWQINETFLDSLIDHKITFKNKGTYILGVYHTNQTQQGQLEENYSIDVDFERKIITDLVSNGTNFTIQSYKGSYDEGTYDSDYAKTSDFWINGCAVEISGLVRDWIKGQTGKVIARVKK